MTNSIDPTRPQFDAFKALPRDTPIHMLNLIRLKKVADYPEGHPDHGKNMGSTPIANTDAPRRRSSRSSAASRSGPENPNAC